MAIGGRLPISSGGSSSQPSVCALVPSAFMKSSDRITSPARARCTKRSVTLTQSPKATNCWAAIGPAMPNTASPRCSAAEIAAGRPKSFFHCSPRVPNSRCRSCAAFSARPVYSLRSPVANAATSMSFCTESTLPALAVIAMPQSEKKSFASSSTFSGASTSESRVKLRSSALRIAASRRSALFVIACLRNAVQVMLPHMQVAFAGSDRRILHSQLFCELFHSAPAGVRVLDVGLGVQLEELELVVPEIEQAPPAGALDAEPAALLELALAVARHVDALGAGVGDDAFEPVAVRHQPFPRRPAELRRSERSCLLDLGALQADAHAELLEDLPVRP